MLLSIGGRNHPVACRDGEEDRARLLGRLLDQRWAAALRASGGVNTERAMFFVALMLADALDEAESRPPAGAAVSETGLERIADRLEQLAAVLERPALEQRIERA